MSSCNLDNSSPLLLLDGSCPRAQVGLLGKDGTLKWKQLVGEVAATLFEATRQILDEAGISPQEIRTWAFCEGPGSTMGIRISAMAIQTWQALTPTPQALLAYRSLDAASYIIQKNQPELRKWLVCSDLRKNQWNCMNASTDSPESEIRVLSEAEMPQDLPRFFLTQRLFSPSQPMGCSPIDYDLAQLSLEHWQLLLHPIEKPQALQTTSTTFKKWKPERHRAPV